MSHFSLLIVGENIKDQMAPFYDGLEVPHIISASELIEKSKKNIEQYRIGMYRKYLEDPEKYLESNASNPGHCRYIANEFPLKLNWTDEEHLADEHEWHEDEDINSDGSINSTSNPKAKWDWFQLGGRWAGQLTLKHCATSGVRGRQSLLDGIVNQNPRKFDSAMIKDIDFEHEDMKEFSTYAILKDGEWYEKGQMFWFGISLNEDDDWKTKFKEILDSVDVDTRISIVDCHI